MISKTIVAVILVSIFCFLFNSSVIISDSAKKEENITKLEGLNWKLKLVTHLGCLKGCLNYLNLKISKAWLFGASGHAFVINIHEMLCPSGPTAWQTQEMMKLCQNVACDIDVISNHKSQPTFPQVQQEVWSKVREAISTKIPCYGWELDMPEFYVIYGYNDI